MYVSTESTSSAYSKSYCPSDFSSSGATGRPIELVTADKDIKKKKKLASKRGTTALQTGLATNYTTGSSSGVQTG